MDFGKVKVYIVVALLFYLSEIFRSYTGLPITIIDIVGLVITCILVYLLRYFKTSFRKENIDFNSEQSPNILQLIGFLFCMLVFAVIGFFIAWYGVQDPLKFFSGSREYSHGYTSIHLGFMIAIYGIWGTLIVLFKLIRYRDRYKK